MVAVTAARADTNGLDNVELHEMDAEDRHFKDEAFDAVTCVRAFMFSPDSERVVREVRRVLKPQVDSASLSGTIPRSIRSRC
jgi:phosphatidylethanolamine/phosphatidyl-N-methylethanolamine N-methyltransferase